MELYGIEIAQDKISGMLSLTDLQEVYTRARIENDWKNKERVQSIVSSEENVERILWILYNEKYIKSLSIAKKEVEETSMVRFLKKINAYKTYGRGDKKQVLIESHIWIFVCFELHPVFYAKIMSYLFENNDNFIFIKRDFEEEELNKISQENHKKAQEYFGIKKGDNKVLHHKNPEWRHFDKKRYAQWNPQDLQVMTKEEHIKLHKKLETDRIYKGLNACELGNGIRNALHKNIPSPNYAAINTALNIKIFGKHQTGMRNLASESELADLSKLEENIAFCISRGFLKTNQEIIEEIKK